MVFVALLSSCGSETETGDKTDTTNAVINGAGPDASPYELPGSDTGAIHENTSTPGKLDKNAGDTTARPQ